MKTLVVLAAAVLVLAGCRTAPSGNSHVDVDSPTLRALKTQVGIAPCPAADASPVHGGAPDVTLPCFGGGNEMNLARIKGPAVISLWANWCTPCHRELPYYQQLYTRAHGSLTLVGVDYEDATPSGAMAALQDAGAKFPELADPGGDLKEPARVAGLPLVLLVAADGTVFRHAGELSSYAALAELVRQHTGVDLTQ